MRLPANGTAFANSLLAISGFLAGIVSSFVAIEAGWFERNERKEKRGGVDSGDPKGNTPPDLWSENALFGDRSKNREDNSGQDPKFQVERARLEFDPQLRSELLNRAGREGARRDLSEALTIGLELERVQDQLDYYRGVYAEWSDTDPESALDYAKRSFHPGTLQFELVSLVMNKWGYENPQTALVWAKSNLAGPLLDQSITDMMIGWTRRNPSSAAGWISNSDYRSQPAFAAIATTWAEQDARAAADWATQVPFRAGRRGATLAVAAEWTRQDPRTAAETMVDLADPDQTTDVATLIADIWGTSDPESAALWISTLPGGTMRDQAAGTLATVWATRDIQSAVAWSESIGDPSMRSRVVNHLGTTWGALEPENAIQWLSGLESQLALPALEGAFNSWAAVQPESMRDWIESSETPSISDRARRSLADVVSQESPLEAIELSLGMSDEALRDDSVARYYRLMRKVDEASADEWYREMTSQLSFDMQTRLERENRNSVSSQP